MVTSSTHCIALHYIVFYCVLLYRQVTNVEEVVIPSLTRTYVQCSIAPPPLITYPKVQEMAIPIYLSFWRMDGHLLHSLYSIASYCILWYSTVLQCMLLFYTIPHYMLLCYAVLYNTILYCTILYWIVHCLCQRWSGHLLHMCHPSVKLREWPAPYTSLF